MSYRHELRRELRGVESVLCRRGVLDWEVLIFGLRVCNSTCLAACQDGWQARRHVGRRCDEHSRVHEVAFGIMPGWMAGKAAYRTSTSLALTRA